MRRYSSSVQKKRIKERDSVSCLFLIEYAIKEQFLLLFFAQNVTFMIENCIEYKVKMR